MSDTKFTKGSWVKDKRGEFLIDESGANVMVYNSGLSGGNKTDESEANAHLIASAPDMYRFIESLQLSVSGDVERDILLAKARGE